MEVGQWWILILNYKRLYKLPFYKLNLWKDNTGKWENSMSTSTLSNRSTKSTGKTSNRSTPVRKPPTLACLLSIASEKPHGHLSLRHPARSRNPWPFSWPTGTLSEN